MLRNSVAKLLILSKTSQLPVNEAVKNCFEQEVVNLLREIKRIHLMNSSTLAITDLPTLNNCNIAKREIAISPTYKHRHYFPLQK